MNGAIIWFKCNNHVALYHAFGFSLEVTSQGLPYVRLTHPVNIQVKKKGRTTFASVIECKIIYPMN